MKLKLNNVEQIWKEQHEGTNKFKYCNFVYVGAYANSVLDSLLIEADVIVRPYNIWLNAVWPHSFLKQ